MATEIGALSLRLHVDPAGLQRGFAVAEARLKKFGDFMQGGIPAAREFASGLKNAGDTAGRIAKVQMVEDDYSGFSGFSNRRKAHIRRPSQKTIVPPSRISRSIGSRSLLGGTIQMRTGNPGSRKFTAKITLPLGGRRAAATIPGRRYTTKATTMKPKVKKPADQSVASALTGRSTFVAGLQDRLDQTADGFEAASNAVCE